jgi:transcription-repair coupling factor (superfamily II helicase)
LVHSRRYPEDGLVAQERLNVETDARSAFLQQLAVWQKDGYRLLIVAGKEGEEKRAQEVLAEDAAGKKLKPRWLRGALNEGFRVTYRAEASSLHSDSKARAHGPRPGWS